MNERVANFRQSLNIKSVEPCLHMFPVTTELERKAILFMKDVPNKTFVYIIKTQPASIGNNLIGQLFVYK